MIEMEVRADADRTGIKDTKHASVGTHVFHYTADAFADDRGTDLCFCHPVAGQADAENI